jgi:hypothetical protein
VDQRAQLRRAFEHRSSLRAVRRRQRPTYDHTLEHSVAHPKRAHGRAYLGDPEPALAFGKHLLNERELFFVGRHNLQVYDARRSACNGAGERRRVRFP